MDGVSPPVFDLSMSSHHWGSPLITLDQITSGLVAMITYVGCNIDWVSPKTRGYPVRIDRDHEYVCDTSWVHEQVIQV